LKEDDFFEAVSEGLSRIIESVAAYDADREALSESKRPHGAEVLHALAQEEAAKYLILMDAVRCPKPRREAHLRAFNDHVAKGIYVECLAWGPDCFGSIRRDAESERDQYFLDGPMGTDWDFKNRIMGERENLLYVDCVDDGNDGFQWVSPQSDPEDLARLYASRSPIVDLVLAFHALGCSNVAALSVIAQKWAEVKVADDMRAIKLRKMNEETLDELAAAGVVDPREEVARSFVIEHWPFPLHSVELLRRRVTPADLKAQRERALYEEMGVLESFL